MMADRAIIDLVNALRASPTDKTITNNLAFLLEELQIEDIPTLLRIGFYPTETAFRNMLTPIAPGLSGGLGLPRHAFNKWGEAYLDSLANTFLSVFQFAADPTALEWVKGERSV